jgi:hypothetical protein
MPTGACKRVTHRVPMAHRRQYGWDASRRNTRGEQEGGKGEKAQFYHTNTTRSHISSHHDGALARLEFVQDPISFLLLLVTVDG